MSLCTLEPFTQSLPINCNLVAYRLTTGASDAPVVTIRRADVEMPVATTVVSTMSNVWMDVPVSRLCDGVTVNEVRPTSYSVLELLLLLGSNLAGDRLHAPTGAFGDDVIGHCNPMTVMLGHVHRERVVVLRSRHRLRIGSRAVFNCIIGGNRLSRGRCECECENELAHAFLLCESSHMEQHMCRERTASVTR